MINDYARIVASGDVAPPLGECAARAVVAVRSLHRFALAKG